MYSFVADKDTTKKRDMGQIEENKMTADSFRLYLRSFVYYRGLESENAADAVSLISITTVSILITKRQIKAICSSTKLYL